MKTWTLLLAALGLAMFLEGLPYFVAPRGMRRYLGLVRESTDGTLRAAGLALMVVGLVVAFIATR